MLEGYAIKAAEVVRKLAARRRELGLTQEEVAASVGMNQAAIGRLEAGRVIPRLDTLLCVADSLGIDVTLSLR